MSFIFGEVYSEKQKRGKYVDDEDDEQCYGKADKGVSFELLASVHFIFTCFGVLFGTFFLENIFYFFHTVRFIRLPFAFKKNDARAKQEEEDDTAEVNDVSAVDYTLADGRVMVFDAQRFDVVSKGSECFK